MFDASQLPYARERRAPPAPPPTWAHAHGLWVEAELGEVGGKDGAHAPGVRTDPGRGRGLRRRDRRRRARRRGRQLARDDRTHRAILDHDLIARLRAARRSPAGPARLVRRTRRRTAPRPSPRVWPRSTSVQLSTSPSPPPSATTSPAEPSVVDPRRYLRPARDAMTATATHLLRVVAGADVPS